MNPGNFAPAMAYSALLNLDGQGKRDHVLILCRHTFGTKYPVDTPRSRQVLPIRPRSASSLEQRTNSANVVAQPRNSDDDGTLAVDKGREGAVKVMARFSESGGQEAKTLEEYQRLAAVADPQYNCLLRPL